MKTISKKSSKQGRLHLLSKKKNEQGKVTILCFQNYLSISQFVVPKYFIGIN